MIKRPDLHSIKRMVSEYIACDKEKDVTPNTSLRWRVLDDTMHDIRYHLSTMETVQFLLNEIERLQAIASTESSTPPTDQ